MCYYYIHLLIHAPLEEVLRLEAEDGEDDGAGVDRGEGVAGGDDVDVLDAVLVHRVVAAEADDGAESQAVRVEHLVGSIQPHGWT